MKIKFLPQNVEVDIKPDQSVLDVAKENNIYIKSVCRGNAVCAECRVNIKEGEFNVCPPTAKELNLIGSLHFLDRRRLACQMKCFGDVTVDLSEQVEKQNQVLKKPRGSTKETDDSKARTGNIIFEQENEAVIREDEKRRIAEDAYAKEEARRELERIRARHRPQEDDSES